VIYLHKSQPLATSIVFNLTLGTFDCYVDANSYEYGLGTSSGEIYRILISVIGANVSIITSQIYNHNTSVNKIFYKNNKYITQDINKTIKGFDVVANHSLVF